jgi:hypothetical protein
MKAGVGTLYFQITLECARLVLDQNMPYLSLTRMLDILEYMIN